VRRTGGDVAWTDGRDVWYHEAMADAAAECEPEPMDAEDPLFILYTSGSTGKPKGVLHTTGGYLVYAAMTHKYTFDYQDGEVYWCTADVGWVTGHTYIVYGPLANGAISLMFEGIPNYPDMSPLLAGRRQAQGQHLLHRAHRHPRADARRRGAGQRRPRASRCASSARWASRSTPRPGSGTTTWSATAAARSSTPGGRPRPAAS
jgi:acyl-CoA synthetase (AMP-forming)/AMP-acid ligase II